jgi:hypothetical protein
MDHSNFAFCLHNVPQMRNFKNSRQFLKFPVNIKVDLKALMVAMREFLKPMISLGVATF